MKNHSYISMQQDMPDQGQLQVTVLDSASNRPVENATVRISYTGVPDNVIEEIRTDSSGKTPMLELAAPPLEYSMKPVEQQPYAEYTVRISAEGFTPKEVAGTEVLPHSIARQGASAHCWWTENYQKSCRRLSGRTRTARTATSSRDEKQ